MKIFKLGGHTAILIHIWEPVKEGESHPMNYTNWSNILLKSRNTHLILDASTEWEGCVSYEGMTTKEFNESIICLKDHNLKNNNVISVISGRASGKKQTQSNSGTKVDWWLDTLAPIIDFYNIWPSQFFVWCNNSQYVEVMDIDHSNLNKFFVCKMRLPHYHRRVLIDELSRNNLLEDNIVSFIDPSNWLENNPDAYKFKYYSGEKRICGYNGWDSPNQQPPGYENCFLELVSESNTVDFYTEKTTQAILFQKPFIIQGARNANYYLQKFGFKIFDELFDYSFDMLPSIQERSAALSDELLRIQNLNLDFNEVRKILQPKIEHNFNRLIELVKHDEYMPNIVREIAKVFPEEEYSGIYEKYKNYKYNEPYILLKMKDHPKYQHLFK